MTSQTVLLFSLASAALAVTPGPTMLMALSNGVAGGLRAALCGMLGACLGAAVLVAAVAAGLGGLPSASELLFQVVRGFGVFYLAWIGWKMWSQPPLDLVGALQARGTDPSQRLDGRVAFARSLTVALSNPKTLLFFAAFLPQFVQADSPQAPQYAVLGAIFIGLDAVAMLGYALLGGQAVRWLARRTLQRIQRGCAVGLWLLAATLAFWRRPSA